MKPDRDSSSEVASILHSSSRAIPEGPSRPTARSLWPQVEDQGAAYQTEAEARRDERNQHSGREASKDNERSAPRHTPHTRGHFEQTVSRKTALNLLGKLAARIPHFPPPDLPGVRSRMQLQPTRFAGSAKT